MWRVVTQNVSLFNVTLINVHTKSQRIAATNNFNQKISLQQQETLWYLKDFLYFHLTERTKRLVL